MNFKILSGWVQGLNTSYHLILASENYIEINVKGDLVSAFDHPYNTEIFVYMPWRLKGIF